jgi:hypothetical protein
MNREGNFVAFSEFMNFIIFARLITYFGNFVYGFSSLRLGDFLYNAFRLHGKMGKMK